MRPAGSRPLAVKDASEVARLLFLLGLEPRLAQVQPQPDGTELWRVPRHDGDDVVMLFHLGQVPAAAPSKVLDPGDLHDFSVRIVQTIPTTPSLLGPGYLDQVLGHLTEAVAARRELRLFLPEGTSAIPAHAFHGADPILERFTAEEITRVDRMLQQLVDDMLAARRTVAPHPPELLLFPGTSFRLSDDSRQAIPTPPLAVEALRGLLEAGWGLVDDAMPGRPGVGLLRHDDGAMLELQFEGGTIVAQQLVEGPDALWSWVQHGFTLTAEVHHALRLHLARARPFQRAVRAALDGIGVNLSTIASLPAGNGRTQRILFAEQFAPRRRGAVVAVVTDADDIIAGVHILEGPGGFDQLARVLHRAALESSDDPALGAMARVASVTDSARLLLGRYLDPEAPFDAITAGLLPRPGDAAKVFRADVAASVERAMASACPRMRRESHQNQLSLVVASVEEISARAPHTRPFAQAWAQLTPWLLPGRLWASWSFHAEGESRGTRYDGLVFIDDHWAWFPKPWRMIEQA